MVEDQEEHNGQGSNISRRNILRNMAVIGAVSGAVPQVSASPADENVDLDEVLNNNRVDVLLDKIPGVELDHKNASIYGSDDYLIVVPSNYGKLLVNNHEEVDASFYFDKWVPDVDDAWPQETEAHLSATDNGPLLSRTATDAEKREFIKAINRPKFEKDSTNVVVVPERGEVSFTRANKDQREIETVKAVGDVGSVGLNQQRGVNPEMATTELQVVDETTYTSSDLTPNSTVSKSGAVTSSSAECDPGKVGVDLFICVVDYSDCAFCTLASSITGPVGIACLIIVCFDGGLSVAMEYFLDWGCASAVEGGVDCLAEIVDEYGHLVPEAPTANDQ